MQNGSSTSVWVVCAAYNEEATIARVVASVRNARLNIVVVDDGSIDRTRDLAGTAGAAVVRHPINLGQGAALKTGIDYALSQGADILVTFDADGQHRVSDIPALLDALARERADFALGSRFLNHSPHVPIARRILLWGATLFTTITTGLRLTDTHNGLRAFTRQGAAALRLRQNRMAHASEILADIAASGRHYVEIPVTIDYTAYSLAKGQHGGDFVMILLDLFARRLHR
ncbi:MAG: polyprenyl-phospho-N-acetylgalactosaminyl synthase [Hyphomicrobiales bacterium]|jgi:glycosyltransferase involved in cell wall biosynthesis